ncbi:hypothetical protein A6A25_21985 [Saccharothrix sp. CB00851]|nr:hypothetical protein A6A25_21985 [Saccharothrix sp. CB00851]
MAVVIAVLLALLGGHVQALAAPVIGPAPVLATTSTGSTPEEDEEYAFYRLLVGDIAQYAPDVEVRDAAQAALDVGDLAALLWFLDHGEAEAKARADERKRAEAVTNRELVQGWARDGGPHVRAGAQAALDSGDDQVIADFVAYGKEIAEKQDQRDAEDSAAERERVIGRVRDMVAHGGPQVKVEGEAILLSNDYARIREFYLTGYAEANRRDHDFQQVIEQALADRNRAITELNDLARRGERAADARAEILRANVLAVESLDKATFAMQMAAKAAHRADQILQEDKPGRANGQRGRDQELDALRADATGYAEQGSRAATTAAGTTAQVQNAAVRLIETGMTDGLDWAKVTIAVGAATEAAARAAETAQHATEATLADSRALDADANAQEHADNARKYREEAERQAQTAAGLAEAAKKQHDIAIGSRDRAAQQKNLADQAARGAATHAGNARNARLTAQSAASNAVTRSQAAVAAHGDAVKAGVREQAAVDAVQRTASELRTATTVCLGKTTFAQQVEDGLKAARDEAIRAGKDADEATRDIAEAAGRARSEANAAAAWAGRAQTAAATAQSEAAKAAQAAQQARQAAALADQEAVTARRAADEANRLAVAATNAAVESRVSADKTRFEAEAAVSEANHAVFQSVIADRAASAAGASAALIVDPAAAADAIARPYAAINADARKAMEVAAAALTIGEEQARSAREKAEEAARAATSAREAADRAVADNKPAYEAAAAAAESANQAAQYAMGANDAANAAAQHAQGAHDAATNAARSASSARADAVGAGNAASVASSAAQSAGQAAAAAEKIHEWAKQATSAIHGFTNEAGLALDQFQDAKRRAEEAQKKARDDAQHKQDELNRQFSAGAQAVLACVIDQLSPQCLELTAKTGQAISRGLSNAGNYVENGIKCMGGDEAACRAYEQATQDIQGFAERAAAGFAEGAENAWNGIVKLGECALLKYSQQGIAACDQIAAGLTDLVQNPYKLIHLDVWQDDPAKAFGLITFDVLAAAVTTPLGGSGSALSKMLGVVSSAVSSATTKIVGGLGRIGSVTVKLADSVTGKLPGAVGEVIGLTVRIENGVAKVDGAIAIVDGVLYRVESLSIRLDGDLAQLEGAIARIENVTMRIENGVAKLDDAQFRWEPKPCTSGALSVSAACGDGNEADIPGRTLDDGSYYARESGTEIRLTPEANRKADDLLALARQTEPTISTKFQQVIDAVPGAGKEGFPQRFKGEESLKRKLFSELGETGATLDSAAAKVNDSLRYTMTFPEAGYAHGVETAIRMLQARGLELTVLKNFWWRNRDKVGGYPGINMTWRDKATGQVFEIQFHTPDSYTAKTVEHLIYEQKRLPNVKDEELLELDRQSDAIFGNVRTPQGAIDFREIK